MKNNLIQFFNYTHLPDNLKIISEKFFALVKELDETLPNNAEKTMAFRKLLEAKDCAVRASIYKEN